MAVKQFELERNLTVSIYKRRGSRNMRLSVRPDNTVRVTIPFWVTYGTGLKFANSKKDWIKQQIVPKVILESGHQVGKTHSLEFVSGGNKARTRVIGSIIKIYHPKDTSFQDAEVQKIAESACLRALKKEATELLPPRLENMANEFGFSYKSVSIKRMKSRWGSCDSNKNIILNLYLMQLPWDVIDYVLLHELTHTNVMKHGPEFWAEMDKFMPDTKSRRKAIKSHKPALLVF